MAENHDGLYEEVCLCVELCVEALQYGLGQNHQEHADDGAENPHPHYCHWKPD